jgi:glycosyltransferase involved in cell wall biosynthesis
VNHPLLSVVIPVYRNAQSARQLVDELEKLSDRLPGDLECVFVIDASPDDSRQRIWEFASTASFRSIIVDHTRNFGSFSAIRTGLAHGTGEYFGVMAADLQEPPDLMDSFVEALTTTSTQLVIGERVSRAGDQRSDRLAAAAFWRLYQRFVMPSMPPGGVDVFGCTREVRDQLLACRESHSSLIGLLFWLGFRTSTVPYERQSRADGGSSSWTFRKKVSYMMDSIYSFTDLPLRLLRFIGAIGLLSSTVVAVIVTIAWAQGAISVPGYTPLMLTIIIATMLILSALGIVGSYVWRAYENTKGRPVSVVESVEVINP